MAEFADIISTEIVNERFDALWGNNTNKEITPKPILVITNDIKDNEEQTVLQKLLQACDIDESKLNAIQVSENSKMTWHSLRDTYLPKVILLIGVHPDELGIASLFRINEVNSFDSRIFIPASSITEMQLQPAIKTQLWNNALKPVFKEKKYFEI